MTDPMNGTGLYEMYYIWVGCKLRTKQIHTQAPYESVSEHCSSIKHDHPHCVGLAFTADLQTTRTHHT